MKKLNIKSAAKINLGLYITAKRANGYHDLSSIFLPIQYYDFIELREAKSGISISMDEKGLYSKYCPVDENNIIHKAYMELSSEFSDIPGVNVILTKNIPMEAGLGGGSSNAASFLKGFNDLYNLGIKPDELKRIGLKLGADVPFFIDQRPSLVSGIGDVLKPFELKRDYYLVIVKPPYGLSTSSVYKAFSLSLTLKTTNANKSKLLRSLSFQGLKKAEELSGLSNDLEAVSLALIPELTAVRQYLEGLNPLVCMMSGSGTAFFAVFEDEPKISFKGFSDDWFFCTTKVLRGHYADHRN